MTLFIACLLIYNFNLSAWWYAVAAGIWALKLFALDKITRDNVRAASCHYNSN